MNRLHDNGEKPLEKLVLWERARLRNEKDADDATVEHDNIAVASKGQTVCVYFDDVLLEYKEKEKNTIYIFLCGRFMSYVISIH